MGDIFRVKLSPNINEYRQILTSIDTYIRISTNINKALNIDEYQQISTNIDQSNWSIFVDIRSGGELKTGGPSMARMMKMAEDNEPHKAYTFL